VSISRNPAVKGAENLEFQVGSPYSCIFDRGRSYRATNTRIWPLDRAREWLKAACRDLHENPAIERFIITYRKDSEERLERHHALFNNTTDAMALVEYREDAAFTQEIFQRFNVM